MAVASVGSGRTGIDGRRTALSDEDRVRAFEWAETGLGSTTIARRLGRDQATVAGYLATLGLTRSRQASVGTTFVQGGRTAKRFDREEDAFIVERSGAGDDLTTIARLCGERFGHPRRANAVRYRLLALASIAG